MALEEFCRYGGEAVQLAPLRRCPSTRFLDLRIERITLDGIAYFGRKVNYYIRLAETICSIMLYREA
jgi:hypothetical protein